MSARAYRMAPGVELVPVDEERFTLRSEFDAFELAGPAAAEFARRVLAELPLGLAEIMERLPDYSPESIGQQLDHLCAAGLLVDTDPEDASPFAVFLDTVGLDARATTEHLAAATVAVFGLEAHGAHLATALARLGIGTIRLVDPHPFRAGHMALTPATDPALVGGTLQAATARLLQPLGTRVECPAGPAVDGAAVRSALDGCDLAFGCWDQGFLAASHWLNTAAIETGVPVLFGELRATSAFSGPLVLPGRSACWMCYRMRAIACAPDFEQAMAFEEHLDRTRRPSLVTRACLPTLPELLASTMAAEALRLLLGLHPPTHVDTVVELEGLTGDVHPHPVLPVPDCPSCGKKAGRLQPPLDELVGQAPPAGDLLAVMHRLVDRRTGVVSRIAAVPRDTTESPEPLVWRATVANHRFFADHDDDRATCSGKGMTKEAAWISCLGEAVERYSAACWSTTELVVARREDLDGRSLDPRELVLYLDEQYDGLPYSRYRDDTELTWISTRSLVHGDEVWVPAIGVLMDYPVPTADEFLFPITSNGLAAGPTPHESVLAALLEVLERDAALVAWYNRLAGRPHDPHQHPDPDVRRLAWLYEQRGVELQLVRVPTDHPVAVFVGIARQTVPGAGPAAVVGLGADLHPAAAARKAALEVGQVRPSVRRRARTTSADRVALLASDPGAVETMEDHALLYTDPSNATALDFLAGTPQPWDDPLEAAPAAVALRTVVDHLGAAGQDVLYANLTPPDMAALGIHTARVVVPGFQPICFGHGERRLGGRRLFDLPVQLGLRRSAAAPADLNPLPHPIA